MGCGAGKPRPEEGKSGVQEPGEVVIKDDDAVRELEGVKMVYNKETKEHQEAKKFDRSEKRKEDVALFEDEVVGPGEQKGACLPYLGALKEPANHLPVNPAEPTENYALEYVYGYRTYDCRNNLFFTAKGKIVYCVAALGVVMDLNANTQSFFGGGTISKSVAVQLDQHNDDIICLAVSPDKRYAATGQVGAQPKLYIWDMETCKMKPKGKYQIKTKNSRAISCVSFSQSGKYVAFVDKQDDHVVYVMNVESGAIEYTDKGGQGDVFDITWSKMAGDESFVTCGSKHIRFWNVTEKKNETGTGAGGMTFTCAAYGSDGSCFAGCTDGQIYVYKGNKLSRKFPAHKGMLNCLSFVDGKFYSGGVDKKLNIYSSAGQLEKTIELDAGPRAVDVQEKNIIVGLKNGTIALIQNGKVVKEPMKSHHDGEVWGLEVLDSGEVLTTGDDNKIFHWDSKTRKSLKVARVNEKASGNLKFGASSMTSFSDNQCARAVCYNHKTNDVAVATNEGEVQIRSLSSLDVVKNSLKASERWIECMAYSPNGEFLAVGTHSNTIVIFSTLSYAKKGALTGNSSAIVSLDWSKDSKYIRTNAETLEILFYTVDNMQQDPSGASNTTDVEWASNSVKIAWNVTGVFPKGCDGTHVNGVAGSADGKLIATGCDYGFVNIYRNPCREGHLCKSFRGHSEHVVRVRFGLGDQYIFSVGGQDKTMMQWKKT